MVIRKCTGMKVKNVRVTPEDLGQCMLTLRVEYIASFLKDV